MYETIFNLTDRPFQATPQSNRYFAAEPIETARQTLIRGIERAEGPGLLIGPPGSGKSLICQLLAEQFAGHFKVVMLSSTRLCTPRALLQNIQFELGLPFRDLEEGELRLNLIDFLQRDDKCPNGILLLVDEANTLPLRLLEEIRMITNVVRDGTPRVRLVLAGGPQLEERFTSPRLESLNQRVAARCYLQSMTRTETANYVRHQIALAGGDARAIFSEDALHAVYHATDGIPRLINQICDHALMLAAAAGVHCLTAANIEESWADLQQLPAPSLSLEGAAAAHGSEAGDIIEFGQLDDDDAQDHVEHQAESRNQDFADEQAAACHETASLDTLVDATDDAPNCTIAMPVVDTLQIQWNNTAPPSGRSDDPFGADFEEEEVVLDRYAALDSNTGDAPKETAAADHDENRGDASVCQESLPISAAQPEDLATDTPDQGFAQEFAMSETVGEIPEIVPWQPIIAVPEADGGTVAEPSQHVDGQEAIDDDAPHDEPTIHGMQSAEHSAEVALEDFPDDDRDMIVIEEDAVANEAVPPPATSRVRRREYRHLFAKLRQR